MGARAPPSPKKSKYCIKKDINTPNIVQSIRNAEGFSEY
jgi:hypothetical protein